MNVRFSMAQDDLYRSLKPIISVLMIFKEFYLNSKTKIEGSFLPILLVLLYTFVKHLMDVKQQNNVQMTYIQ